MAFTDTFTGTNDTALSTYSANWLAVTDTLGMRIYNNGAAGSNEGGSSFSCNRYNGTFASEHYSKGTLAITGTYRAVGVAVRIQSAAASFFYAIYDANDTNVYVGIMAAGTATDYGSGVAGFATGDVIELAVTGSGTGTVLTLKKNGATAQTYNHATYGTIDDLTGGAAGVCAYGDSTTSLLADWEGGDVGAAATEITAGVGTLTLTGQTPGRTTEWYRNPGAGALTAGGYAPTFIERGLRYAYPTADVSDGTWLPSTGTDLYAAIDEEPASDTDYIYTNAAGACEIRLLPVTDPASSSGYALNYRIWSPVGGNAVVRLKQGATTIATWTHTGLPTSATAYSQALSAAEADSITDHDDLRIEIEAT